MTRQQILETSPMQTQNAFMKYLLMIFVLIFVGCSEYPITKINCMTASYAGGVESSRSKRSYAFVDSNLFKDAEVEIFDTYPSTFKCGTYFQNNSSIKCSYDEEFRITEIFYNKLDQTIRHELTYEDEPRMTNKGLCEDA